MPLFIVKWDGMGFTSDEDETEMELTEEQAAQYTQQLKAEGAFPAGIHGVLAAHVAPDEVEGGEWKVFVCCELLVEADSEAQVWRLQAPEAFLLQVASHMVKNDADSTYGLTGTFEILEVEEYRESVAGVDGSP